MKKSIWLGAAALAATTLAMGPASANHQWGRYKWGQTGVVSLNINVSVGSAWNSAVAGGNADWNDSAVLSLTSRNVNVDRTACNPISGEVVVCSAAYGDNGWLGIASVWAIGGQILQATTKLNDTYYDPNYANGYYDTAPWRALVACQEVGHDFGLAHQDETFSNRNLGSCMDYTNEPAGGGAYGPSNEHPNQHDYDQLASMYGGGGKKGGGGGGKPSRPQDALSFREVGNAPQSPPSHAEFGVATGYDARGRANVFERTLPSGVKKITHVFWRPDVNVDDHTH